MNIDPCAVGPRHNVDPQPWHIRYRHRCLSTRQRQSSGEEASLGNAPYSSVAVPWLSTTSSPVSSRAPQTAKRPRTLASSSLSCPGLCPRSAFRCCCCAAGTPRCLPGRQSRHWPPYFSSSADNALWISRISTTDRKWYANTDTSVDMFGEYKGFRKDERATRGSKGKEKLTVECKIRLAGHVV